MIDADALVRFTQELVRIPSVHDPHRGLNEEPAAELVAAQMRSFGWTPMFDLVAPGRPNVIAFVEGGDGPGPTLMFEGHTDVVTEGDGWTVDPFGGEIRDGRLCGTGSADMKGGLAAMLFAGDALVRRGPFPGRLVLAALVDEEGMMLGAKDLVARGRTAGVDGVICGEPEGGEICHVAKGALRLRLDFHGKMAHGAMPFQGRNPNRAVGVDDHGTGGARARPAGPPSGGSAPGPSVAHDDGAGGRRRRPDERDAGRRIDVVGRPDDPGHRPRRAPRRADDGRHRCRWRPRHHGRRDGHRRPAAHRHGGGRSPGTRAVGRPCGDRWERPRLGGVPGATDGTVIDSRTGMPSVVYGPGGKWIAHQADEFVEIDDIITHARVYVEAADRFLRA